MFTLFSTEQNFHLYCKNTNLSLSGLETTSQYFLTWQSIILWALSDLHSFTCMFFDMVSV